MYFEVPEYRLPYGDYEVASELGGRGSSVTVPTDFNLLTDSNLIAFYFNHIHETGHNWFILDFGDGTGFMFSGSRNLFRHVLLNTGGQDADPNNVWNGQILEDFIVFNCDDGRIESPLRS